MEPGQVSIPGSDAPAPAPAPAPEPAPAPAPAPEPTQQPETPPVEPTQQPETPPEQDDDAKEWEDVENELFPGLTGNNKEPKKDEPPKPEAEPEKAPEGETPPEGAQPPEKPADPEKPEGEEVSKTDSSATTARIEQRQSQAQYERVKSDMISDIREKMYKDLPTELVDGDGDPIRSIEDVMKHIDPRTGEPFTEEAAGLWFLNATQQFKQNLANINQRVEKIAEVNIAVKDEADVVNEKYGEILKNNTDLRDRLWAQFEKTLVKDPQTGIIIDMPVSLLEFYDITMSPYANQAPAAQSPAAAPPAPEEPKETPEQQEERRKKERSDRSDIFGGGDNKNLDPEDKEWAEAHQDYFGSELSKR